MKKVFKQIILFYLVIVLLKILLSSLIPAPSAYSDSYVYMKLARSFFFDFDFTIHSLKVNIYPPLYPLVLSISYIFKDMTVVYFLMKVINALISSLIIFPAFLLSKEFLSKKKSLIIALLISIIPSNFSFTPYIMSENLFYPLFLFAIYFIYISYKSEKYRYPILAGLFIALSILTRSIGLSLIAILILSSFILILFNKSNGRKIIKKTLIILLFFLIIISPWIIKNIVDYGSIFSAFFSNYSNEAKSIVTNLPFTAYIIRFLMYVPFLILSSLIIFPLKSLSAINKKNLIFSVLFVVSLFVALVIAANHGARGSIYFFELFRGRYIGRYIAYIIPLIFIGGFIGMNRREISKKVTIVIFSILLILGSLLTLHSLFPVNNLSLSWIGALKYFFEFIFYNKTSFTISFLLGSLIFFSLFFLMIFIVTLFLERKRKLSKVLPYLFIFVILFSLLSYGITYYDSKVNFYDKEQMQLGLWLNDYDNGKVSNVLFDERDCGLLNKYDQVGICGGFNNTKTIIGYWLNEGIVIGDISNLTNINYVISKHKLDLELLKTTRSEIYLYRVD